MRQQFIVLPSRGVRALSGPAHEALVSLYLAPSELKSAALGLPNASLSVVDSIQENGAKLVEMDAESAAAVNLSAQPIRALPLVEYPRPDLRPQLQALAAPAVPPGAAPAASPTVVVVSCVDGTTGAPIADADVIAFTNFVQRAGDRGRTDAAGQVRLTLSGSAIDRLYVYAPDGYWGGYRQSVPAANISIPLEPVNLGFVDLVRHHYGASRFVPAAKVRVGILDTGGGPHQDLNFSGGRCTVTGDLDADWKDYGIHGTHVAGLVGASGGLRGVAPGVDLRAYRVFPRGTGGATNYAILKALISAANDGCDIVNLSLGGGPFDEIVEEAIEDACNQGMLPIIAAGNDGRKAVSYPAAHRNAVAVSALGRAGSFPAGSLDEADILRPPHSATDPMAFIAAFSNVGPQIAVCGPGVGVLSTLPNNRYAPLSGTSMAAPVVAGALASLLSQNGAILGMPRDRARSDALRALLQQNCVRVGFGSNYEGYGMPDPAVV